MRITFVTTLILIAAVAGAQPPQPTTAPVPTQSVSEQPLMVLDIPSQIVNTWYARGNAEEEAEDLQTFLRALIWGIDGEADALAAGNRIDVDANGLILMRESPENMERIRRHVDPSLATSLRVRQLDGATNRQVAPGIVTSDPTVGAEMLRRAANRPPEPDPSYGSSGSSGSSVARMALRLDNDRYWRGLRVTLLDVFEETESDRLTAVLTVDTSDRTTEVEIGERRSIIVDNFRIRFLEGSASGSIEAVIEVTDLVATSR